jgi:hypothetical protein
LCAIFDARDVFGVGRANVTTSSVTVTISGEAFYVSPVKLIAALGWSHDIVRRGRTLRVTPTRCVADTYALRVCKTVILAFLEPAFAVERPVEVAMNSVTGESLVKLGWFTFWIITVLKSFREKVLSCQRGITIEF